MSLDSTLCLLLGYLSTLSDSLPTPTYISHPLTKVLFFPPNFVSGGPLHWHLPSSRSLSLSFRSFFSRSSIISVSVSDRSFDRTSFPSENPDTPHPPQPHTHVLLFTLLDVALLAVAALRNEMKIILRYLRLRMYTTHPLTAHLRNLSLRVPESSSLASSYASIFTITNNRHRGLHSVLTPSFHYSLTSPLRHTYSIPRHSTGY